MESSEESRKHLALLKNSVRTTYQAVGKVYCPILGENIVFNSIGFRHLYIKPDGTYKDVNEAIYKLTYPSFLSSPSDRLFLSDQSHPRKGQALPRLSSSSHQMCRRESRQNQRPRI